MKVCFAGYGSIARRHIANLAAICGRRGEQLTVDLLRHRPAAAPDGVRLSVADAGELDGAYDAVFVTNPTSEHERTLLALLGRSDAFFVEKPAFGSSDVDASRFACAGKAFYVACPLRYSSVIRWVKSSVDPASVLAARAISSSYLPDWRPGTDYRGTYSARASLGGGVHIDLIHEWDYLVHLFGFPREVKSIVAKRSQLEVDSDDVALYIADYGHMTAEVHLDYFGRAPIRRLELFCRGETYACDLIAGRVDMLASGGSVLLPEARDDYQARELEHFLDIAEGRAASDNGIEHAMAVMRLAEGGPR